MTALTRIGIVVHPSRDIGRPLAAIREWAEREQVPLVQIPVLDQRREVAEPGTVESCELIVAIGGDGTTLAALRAAVPAERPVLGVACGSLGALTGIMAGRVSEVLTKFRAGDWTPVALPALKLSVGDAKVTFALNDMAVVRAGQGQMRTTAQVDGAVFARFVGDGCIVSTPVGSGAYALAAGAPLLMPGADAFVLTPLTVHGGFCPPLVLVAGTELELEVSGGFGGCRLEVDGQVEGFNPAPLRVNFCPEVATMATFGGQELFLAGLRRRQIIIDSPRILAEEGKP